MDEGVEQTISFGPRLLHVGGLEGLAEAESRSVLRAHGEVDPPGAVVVPEVVIVVGVGDSKGDAESGIVGACHDGVDLGSPRNPV